MAAPQPLPIDRLLTPFREFSRSAAAGGIVLIAAAIVALAWANSSWSASYDALWETHLSLGTRTIGLDLTLHEWINDGLMALFFLLVGLEIKREVLVGELHGVRRATLPVAAAVGGAVLPALIYLAIAGDGPGARGWGIPMATDIAFALGVLALLGDRVPPGLRIFLAALAIADDLIAVLVIAAFYTADLDVGMLAGASAVVVLLVGLNRLGVTRLAVYATLGLILWVLVLQSGIHATVAGVLLALTIPSRIRIDPEGFVRAARAHIDAFEAGPADDADHDAVGARDAALWRLEEVAERARAPMIRMEHLLQPWVAFLIVPLFALANAGVTFEPALLALPPAPVITGIVLGLVIGKQVGIMAATWGVVRLGLAALPAGVTWRQVYAVGWLGGIGFTMSLFIAELALEPGEPLSMAKIGILAASAIAGTVGWLLLRRWTAAPAAA